MKNKSFDEYMKQTSKIAPRLMKSWWELDSLYNLYSELMKSAFQMKCRFGKMDGDIPRFGCVALWKSAEDLEIHFREKMDERREELNADRDCISPMSPHDLLQLQLEDGFIDS